jgi:replicative DNA helicase
MYTNLPLVIDDRAGQSVTDIQVKARRESVRGGLDLVVVDYLQIAARDSTSYEEVTAVSNGLKKLAKDLDIPVIALSQLSRMIEQRDNKRPTLSDLKQSGGLEQDADLVGMLHYPDRRKMNELEFDVIKHRNGELGRVLFNFQKNIQTFEEIGGGSDE